MTPTRKPVRAPHYQAQGQGGSRRHRRRRLPHRAKDIMPVSSGEARLDRFSKDTLRIIALGGYEEVGKNCTILEYGDDIIIIDLGLQFPEEDMPGIDYIIPNMNYLRGKEKNVRAVIITHGHYDHIGGIPHIMPQLGNPPLVGTDLTIGIIKKRQEDFREQLPNLRAVKTNEELNFGVFKIEFFMVSHNIPASLGLIIHTPVGIIVHTGDFKFDLTPAGSSPTEVSKIAELGMRKVLVLLADSTNAQYPGYQLSESEISHNLKDVIKSASGRVIIGTFASLLGRIQQIIWIAEELGKKVIAQGYSLRTNLEIARELGYIEAKKGTIIMDWKEAKGVPDDKQVIICTGAQGEERAALVRIANKEHRFLEIQKGDTIIFSSSVVPGNERSVQRLKDLLYRQEANVVHYQMMDVHAGGHAKQEDLKWLIKLVNPKYYIPCEGNHSFLRINAQVAKAVGIPDENIFVPDNGGVVEFKKVGKDVIGRLTGACVPADPIMIDGLGAGNVDNVVLRDRQMLAADGMIVIIATVRGKTGQLVGNPDIISRGFVHLKESKPLIEQVRKCAKKLLLDRDPRSPAFEAYLKTKMRDDLGQFIFQKTQRRPMILPVLIEV